MKNIHVLPTDKPSRLLKHIYFSGLVLSKQCFAESIGGNITQHIYITSDEEIKVGDWTLMFDGLGNLFLCDKPQQYLGIKKGHHLNKGLRKIILTTDQDLINDGVQAIDDDFLEWFVAHPSCEEIEVKPYHILSYLMSKKPLVGYRIIIPKEEPKQESCEYIKEVGCIKDICTCNTGPKQETLEEAAANLADPNIDKTENWIAGAKWMQEQMEKLKDFDTWKKWKNKSE